MNLSSNCLHITVNSRLTQFLKAEFMLQQSKNQSVVFTPQVMTWKQWWHSWQDALLLRGELSLSVLPKKVISDFEAQNLWLALLEDACEQEGLLLLNQAQTAKQLHQAWLYEHEYLSDELDQTEHAEHLFFDLYLSEETQLYLRLKKRYLQVLSQRELWDSALLMQHRLEWFDAVHQEPLEVRLHGFDVDSLDDLSPYMKRWLSLIHHKGGQVQLERLDKVVASQQLYSASDEGDEVEQAAIWAYSKWKELTQQKNASPRIAIVAPDISAVETPLVWALDELLFLNEGEPLKLFQNQAAPSKFYNVSLGQPLSEVPLVRNALQTLAFAISVDNTGESAKFDYNEVSEWLNSPYTPGHFVERQGLDFRLRSWQWARLSISELYKALQNTPKASGEESAAKAYVFPPKPLLKALKAITQPGRFLNEQESKKLSVQEFYDRAIALLEASGWADSSAEGALNSVEFQQKQAFLKAFYSFIDQLVLSPQKDKTQDGVERMTALAWYNRLRQFVSEQLHQPESINDAPIQIMGMLEAGGQQFDALWVLGMTASAWPREAKPNPFLPISLQRLYQLPRADVARELGYAQILTKRLATSADEVVWSYAQQTKDGQLNLMSPLVERQFKAAEKSSLYQPVAFTGLSQALFADRTVLDEVEDAQAPEVAIGQKVPGGAAILTAQQKCPLMAFFDYRLGAKYQLEKVEQGMQSNHLGTLVHQVLEWFWQEVRTQSALNKLSDEQLHKQLDALLQKAMEPMQQHFNAHYLALEKKRISHLLFDWLQLEKQRPPFEVIAFEQGVELDLAGIKLSIKIDRIDQLEGGEAQTPVFILDYKTGKATINDLLKVPLEAPQLAIYLHAFEGEASVLPSADIKGLGYGMIHSDDGVKFSVVAENEDFMPHNKSANFAKLSDKEGGEFEGASWEDFLNHLKTSVMALAASVQRGDAAVLFDKPTDIQYAASLLALRLPEAEALLVEG